MNCLILYIFVLILGVLYDLFLDKIYKVTKIFKTFSKKSFELHLRY